MKCRGLEGVGDGESGYPYQRRRGALRESLSGFLSAKSPSDPELNGPEDRLVKRASRPARLSPAYRIAEVAGLGA